MDNCCNTSAEWKRLQNYLLHMNLAIFITTNSVYKMLMNTPYFASYNCISLE